MKRAHRLRQKNVGTKERILKERAGRKHQEVFHKKHVAPSLRSVSLSQAQHPKSWRRAGKI